MALIPSRALADPTFPVMNASGGIYWRSAPDWNTAEAVAGNGFYPGTVISVQCYQSGAANVPGSSDSMWEQATWSSGPGSGHGWINEHFINDGSAINQPSPGVPSCSSSPPPPPPPLPSGQYYVMNASGGIYWRSAPDWNTAEAVAGNGFYPGTVIAVHCYQSGAANVPGSTDSMWEQASWVSGPGTGSGWINEHFINDGSPINQPSPGASPCAPSPPPATTTTSPSPPAPSDAATDLVYTIVNAAGGIYYRDSPHWADTTQTPGVGVYDGDQVKLICGTAGDPVGPYGNTWWSYVQDLSRPSIGDGWVNEHYINDGAPAGSGPAGEPACSGSGATPQGPAPTQNTSAGANDFYDRSAAVSWALANALDPQDHTAMCAYFVSHALWAGAFPKSSTWTDQGSYGLTASGTSAEWQVGPFLSYLEGHYSTTITNITSDFRTNAVPGAEPGDIIIYDWGEGEGMSHMSFIVDMAPGDYPEVSEMGQFNLGPLSSIINLLVPLHSSYVKRGWTWSAVHGEWLQQEFPGVQAYLLHINGGYFASTFARHTRGITTRGPLARHIRLGNLGTYHRRKQAPRPHMSVRQSLGTKLGRSTRLIASYQSCVPRPGHPGECARTWRIADMDGRRLAATSCTLATLGSCEDLAPVYDPRTRRIAVNDAGGIAVANARLQHARLIPHSRSLVISGPMTWSPDGSSLMVPTVSGNLYIVQVASGRIHRWRAGYGASWASTGQIAYRNLAGHLMLARRLGSRPRQLAATRGATVLFSPNGRLLAYGCEADRDVCIMDLRTGRERPLIRGTCDTTASMPYAWRPDSRALLCVGRTRAYLIDVRTLRRRRITNVGDIVATNRGLGSLAWIR